MKVLLLNPPFLKKFSREQRSPAVTKSGTLYYPLWLSYATGVLEHVGLDAKLIDAPARGYNLSYIQRQVMQEKFDLVIIDTSTPSIYNDIKVGEGIKELIPQAYVVLVGPHVSALPQETLSLSPKIEAIARREYEYTIRDLAFTLQEGGSLENIKGLSYRIDGLIRHNSPRDYIKDLDAIPFVSRVYKRHLNIKDYFYSHSSYPLITIISSRGCPYQCTFCLYPQTFLGHQYRCRSIGNVMEELKYISTEFPRVKAIMFEDDTFTLDEERCQSLCEEIIRLGLKISWGANSRVDIGFRTLELMKRAGCRLLCAGFESTEQEILDRIGKKTTVAQMRQFMRDTKKLNILVNACFMVGNQGETRASLMKTLEFAKETKPYTAQFIPLLVYPGTKDYEWAKTNNYLLTEDYSQWCTKEGLFNSTLSTPELSAKDLTRFCNYAKKSYYLRPSYLLMKLKENLLHPGEIRRNFVATRLFLKNLIKGY